MSLMAADSGVGSSSWQIGSEATESCHHQYVLFDASQTGVQPAARGKGGTAGCRGTANGPVTLDSVTVETVARSCRGCGWNPILPAGRCMLQCLIQRVGDTAKTGKLYACRAL